MELQVDCFTYIFFALAAVCNAVMDRIENSIQFNQSVFNRLNPEFWCKTISAHSVKFIPFTKYRLDAWHLFKSLMIIFIVLAIIFYNPFIYVLDFVILGIIWNLVFNIFYNKVFYDPR